MDFQALLTCDDPQNTHNCCGLADKSITALHNVFQTLFNCDNLAKCKTYFYFERLLNAPRFVSFLPEDDLDCQRGYQCHVTALAAAAAYFERHSKDGCTEAITAILDNCSLASLYKLLLRRRHVNPAHWSYQYHVIWSRIMITLHKAGYHPPANYFLVTAEQTFSLSSLFQLYCQLRNPQACLALLQSYEYADTEDFVAKETLNRCFALVANQCERIALSGGRMEHIQWHSWYDVAFQLLQYGASALYAFNRGLSAPLYVGLIHDRTLLVLIHAHTPVTHDTKIFVAGLPEHTVAAKDVGHPHGLRQINQLSNTSPFDNLCLRGVKISVMEALLKQNKIWPSFTRNGYALKFRMNIEYLRDLLRHLRHILLPEFVRERDVLTRAVNKAAMELYDTNNQYPGMSPTQLATNKAKFQAKVDDLYARFQKAYESGILPARRPLPLRSTWYLFFQHLNITIANVNVRDIHSAGSSGRAMARVAFLQSDFDAVEGFLMCNYRLRKQGKHLPAEIAHIVCNMLPQGLTY